MTRTGPRVLRFSALTAFGLALAFPATATPIVPKDPVVRVRDGSGSVPIRSLPFSFSFGTFPEDPDGPATDCRVGTEPLGTVVTCLFRNLTGNTIGLLDITYAIPTGSGPLVFEIEDPDNFFVSQVIDPLHARFEGAGIPSDFCGPELCVDGLFAVDLVGFPEGTTIEMAAQAGPIVPEPGTLSLLALGLAAAVRRTRRSR